MTYAFILQKTRKLPVDFLIPSAVTFYIKRAIVNRPVHSNMSSDIVVIACCNNSRTFRRIHVVLFVSIIIPFLVSRFFFTFSNTRLIPHSLYSRYPVSNNFRKNIFCILYTLQSTHAQTYFTIIQSDSLSMLTTVFSINNEFIQIVIVGIFCTLKSILWEYKLLFFK